MSTAPQQLRDRTKAFAIRVKIGLVEEEADESVFWIEMLADCEVIRKDRLNEILKEACELSAIFTAAQRSARVAG